MRSDRFDESTISLDASQLESPLAKNDDSHTIQHARREAVSNREPPRFRFRLRQLMAVTAAASLFYGLLVLTEGPWPLVTGVGLLLVVGHVLGNVLGTRLRDTSVEVRRFFPEEPVATKHPVDLNRIDLPRASLLRKRDRIHSWGPRSVVAGAVTGALIGGVVIALTIGDRLGGWAVAVGIASSAVLGTWVAFLGCRFSSIAKHAWRECQKP